MIRAVFFDAVGTLIHPAPLAADVYYEAGRRHGSSRATVARRFAKAFRKQEDIDRHNGWATSARRELERWQSIVAEVLDDVTDPEACFAELYEHFARPESWTCAAAAEEVLAGLRRRGLVLGVASNYDHRLRTVIAGLAPLRGIDHLLISSEVGWRKPAPAFFAALVRQAGLPPAEILLVGDDRDNDYDGARAAGLQAVLVSTPSDKRIGRDGIDALRDLPHHPSLT
ncbi:MAG: HAD family hydrolase [Gemmataceae bacterium]|nr:HAD family hydrolase [Gemmataceae bacterium]